MSEARRVDPRALPDVAAPGGRRSRRDRGAGPRARRTAGRSWSARRARFARRRSVRPGCCRRGGAWRHRGVERGLRGVRGRRGRRRALGRPSRAAASSSNQCSPTRSSSTASTRSASTSKGPSRSRWPRGRRPSRPPRCSRAVRWSVPSITSAPCSCSTPRVESFDTDVLVVGRRSRGDGPGSGTRRSDPRDARALRRTAPQRRAGRGADGQSHLDEPPVQGPCRGPRHRRLRRRSGPLASPARTPREDLTSDRPPGGRSSLPAPRPPVEAVLVVVPPLVLRSPGVDGTPVHGGASSKVRVPDVLTLAAAVVSFFDLRGVADRTSSRLPARGLAAFVWVVVVLNTLAWLGGITPALLGDAPGDMTAGMGVATNPVYVQDLAVWLPLATVGAWWLWHRRVWGGGRPVDPSPGHRPLRRVMRPRRRRHQG